MMVMPSNNGGIEVGLLAAKYLGRVGHLYSPGGQRGPYEEIEFALDNECWIAFKNRREWSPGPWRALLRWALLSGKRPLWALVPDVVGDRVGTLARWAEFSPEVKAHGFRRGFAVQNGMTFDDVPDDECMLFLGGDSQWKDAAIPVWADRYPGRVHVGRVNGMPRLLACHHSGVVSVDGTGWFHKTGPQNNDLRRYLKETSYALSARS